MGCIMGYLISTNQLVLEALQLKIHNYMIDNIPNYNAVRWATVKKHPTKNEFAVLIKESDPRLPYRVITNSEKLQLIDKLPDGWIEQDAKIP